MILQSIALTITPRGHPTASEMNETHISKQTNVTCEHTFQDSINCDEDEQILIKTI